MGVPRRAERWCDEAGARHFGAFDGWVPLQLGGHGLGHVARLFAEGLSESHGAIELVVAVSWIGGGAQKGRSILPGGLSNGFARELVQKALDPHEPPIANFRRDGACQRGAWKGTGASGSGDVAR